MRRVLFAIMLAAALIGAPPVHAQRVLDLRDAVELVQRETGGRILAAETVRIGKQKVYRVKVLTREGLVKVVLVPAAERELNPEE